MADEGGAREPEQGPTPSPGGLRRVAVAVVIVVGALVVVGLSLRTRQKTQAGPSAPDPHRDGLESSGSVYLAALQAPEGRTPCESTFNALEAMQKAVDAKNLPPLRFSKMPTRAELVAACESLPADEQVCLVPRYRVQHREECEAISQRVQSTDAGAMLRTMLTPDDPDTHPKP